MTTRKNGCRLATPRFLPDEIQRRTGRYPILYTNGKTAKHIADNRLAYPLLSRLPLWYARYKPEIGMHFPKGNWESYALWQFSAQANCNAKACPYRIKGAKYDIDVNVATVDAETLRQVWPFGGLVGLPVDVIASVPVPVERTKALQGKVETTFAPVALEPGSAPALAYAYLQAGNRYLERPVVAPPKIMSAMASAFAAEPAMTAETEPEAFRSLFGQAIDPVTTASVGASPFKRDDFPVFLLETPDRRR